MLVKTISDIAKRRKSQRQKRQSQPGARSMSQVFLTALFALSLSFLAFAASFAEAPRSEFLPALSQSE